MAIRRILFGLAGLSFAAALCTGAAIAQQPLTIVASGGAFENAMKDAFYAPFTKATQIEIRPIASSISEQWTKVKAMQSMGTAEWDIVSMNPDDLVTQRDLLLDLGKCEAIPNAQKVGIPGTCEQFGVLRGVSAMPIVYNTSKLGGNGPKNWADFWDVKKFPGGRAMPNSGSPWVVLMAALMADGVAADKLFPLDLDRAFKKLDQIKPHVTTWWKTGDQSQQAIRGGEAVMGFLWGTRSNALVKEGQPVALVWNGAVQDVAYWGVLKSTKNKDQALKFLDFFIGNSEGHKLASDKLNVDGPNKEVVAQLSPAERAKKLTSPENWSSVAKIDFKWIADNKQQIQDRWNAWISK